MRVSPVDLENAKMRNVAVIKCVLVAESAKYRLPQDVLFIIRKNGSVEARTTMEAGPAAQGPPLTLLVDKGTASAAEVFAAAVRYEVFMRANYGIVDSTSC